MVLPYIEFANVILLWCTEQEKKKVQNIQNKGQQIRKIGTLVPTCFTWKRNQHLGGTRALIALMGLIFNPLRTLPCVYTFQRYVPGPCVQALPYRGRRIAQRHSHGGRGSLRFGITVLQYSIACLVLQVRILNR